MHETRPVQAEEYQILMEPKVRPQIEVKPGRNRLQGSVNSPGTRDRRIEVTAGAHKLSSKEEVVVERYIESLNNKKQVNPADQWREMGGQGQLIDLDTAKGKMLLDISGEAVEIEFDPVQ